MLNRCQSRIKNWCSRKQAQADVGAYHYCYAKTVAAAKAEAAHLLKVIKPYKLTYPVVLDEGRIICS